MDKRTIASGVIGIVAISGGVDASILNERPIPLTEVYLKEEVATIEQKGNVIEAGMPWRDQAGIKVKYDMKEPTIAERLSDKRKAVVITETVDIGDGGFKIDVLLNEKPDTNTFCYTIEGAENYDFFLQPALTAEEIAEGASRPEEIVGSYAVYHKTLKNHIIGQENYATGKVMHIPFPYVWEVNASSTTRQRAENMTYENGSLCVVVQQDFLDKATYPVRVDPTFGYTTIGASTSGFAAGSMVGTLASLPEAGTITSITGHINSDWTAGEPIRFAIYSSGGAYSSVESSASSAGGTGWTELSSSGSLSAASYYVVAWTSAVQVALSADTGSSGQLFDSSLGATYPSWPATVNGLSSTLIKSIYATYTVSGSTPQKERVIFFE